MGYRRCIVAENAEQETQIVRTDEQVLDETQMAEQLYSSAGLDPVVDAGLKDYDEIIRSENKLINKVLGPRESDIKGYGESVAKRVAYAVYALLNRQYGGKVGDLRSYIMDLEDERNRANIRYDELMGRVIGILGEEYKNLRTDSKEFMEKLNTTLGEDLKASKIDQTALAESLADIDGMRNQISTLENEKKQLTEKHQAETTELKKERRDEVKALNDDIKELQRSNENKLMTLQTQHVEEVKTLNTRIAELEASVKSLESENARLNKNLEQLQAAHDSLNDSVAQLAETIPAPDLGVKIGEELYAFVLKDSRVPDAVIKGVGQFIDFRKYLKMAAEKGVETATAQAKDKLHPPSPK